MAEPLSDLQASEEILSNVRNRVCTVTIAGSIVYAVILQRLFETHLLGDSGSTFVAVLGVFILIGGLAMRGWRREADWGFTLGYLALTLVAPSWLQSESAICLLVIPVGLASLLLGMRHGFVATVLISIIVFWGAPLLKVNSLVPRTVALAVVWATHGFVWTIFQCATDAAAQSLRNYNTTRTLLEDARDQRLKLKETQEDLVQANVELARLAERLEYLRGQAQDARRAKEEFVANVSHELRTPLNMIIGFTEMIVQSPITYQTRLPGTLLADIDVVYRNSKHLLDLINDVLDLSQTESGRMMLRKEEVSVEEIIREAMVIVTPLFESKELSHQASVAPGLPPLSCDRTRIRQVLLNLLSNAGRFTDQGGIKVCAWQEDDEVVVSVEDTGPGIAAQDMDKIFEPFRQVDGSTSRRHGGTGLGLSISKRFVEMHGGKMWVESQEGVGTTFYFSLPVQSPPSPDRSGSRWFNPYSAYEARTRGSLAPQSEIVPRFVILEKGVALQHLFGHFLEDEIEIVHVQSIEGAVEELKRAPAQALIVNDPRANDPFALPADSTELPYDTPLIACWVPGKEAAAEDLGAVDYLVKPIERETLLRALKKVNREIKEVLLVDDETEALQLFARILASAEDKYHVIRATNGRQALELLKSRQPDVMLLDLVMPDMDGFRVLAKKARDEAIRDVPVIIISAKDPLGTPIASSTLVTTRNRGLVGQEIVDCIRAVSGVLSPA